MSFAVHKDSIGDRPELWSRAESECRVEGSGCGDEGSGCGVFFDVGALSSESNLKLYVSQFNLDVVSALDCSASLMEALSGEQEHLRRNNFWRSRRNMSRRSILRTRWNAERDLRRLIR